MTKSKFRKILAGSLVAVYLVIGLLSGIYIDFLNAFESMTLPVSIVLGGYFGRHIANELNNKTKKKEENNDYS